MSIQLQKVPTVAQLLIESRNEERESEALARKIEELTRQSQSLSESAKQKLSRVMTHLHAVEGSVDPAATAAEAAAPAKAASGKKTGGRAKAVAIAAAAPAPTVAAATPAPAKTPKATASKGKGKDTKAKEVKESKEPKTKPSTKVEKKPKAAKAAAETAATGESDKPGPPPLHERLRIVIGADDVDITQAIERLKAHEPNWLPNSTDLNAYISLALSTHVKDLPGGVPGIFERVSRGVYRVRKAAAVATAAGTPRTSGRGPKKAVTAAKTNGAQNPSNGAVGIEDLGTNVLDNPFAGAA